MRPRQQAIADISTGPRSAVIDIGSNTVRLVIYGGARRAPIVLWNEKVAAKLGRDLAETRMLAEDSMVLALEGLARYAALLNSLGIDDVEAVATAAVRDARNGAEFLAQVRELGLQPRLLSGEEEANVGAMGVLGAFPGARGVVADLGGGSMELTGIGPEGCIDGISLPLGTLRLAKLRKDGAADFRAEVDKILRKAGWVRETNLPLFLVGGTFRAMATYVLRSGNSPLDDPHGLDLPLADALKFAKSLSRMSPEQLVKIQGVSQMRSAVIPDAAALLMAVMQDLEPSRIVFSSWGLREGLLYQRLEPTARMQDPLIAGVSTFSAPRGGRPDLAARIAGWTAPAAPRTGNSTERIRFAATMLALASMQIEPNLRARQGLDWALHKRWIDLDAKGRAMLAAALLANCGTNTMPGELTALADEKTLQDAVSWGLAIRLCRRLGANAPLSLERTALSVEEGRLALLLGESVAALRNRGVEKDLDKLAQALGLEAVVEIVPDDGLSPRRSRAEAVS